MGMIICTGTEKEVRAEYELLLEKAKKGFNGSVTIKDKSFTINTSDITINFNLDKLFKEYAIFQIIN